jgi:DHA1 family multidrug resistance protein-like MFS transporter
MELWRKNLYILWATQFLAMVGMNLVVPFLPFYIRELGVTDPTDLARWSGLVFAGPFFLSVIATPLWGTLGDRYGRKVMVIRAIIGLAISQVLIGLAQDVVQLFLFRIVQGGISGFIAASLALVSTTTPRERMGYALGFMQSSSAAGTVLGPAVGGVLADLIGYREIFFITATLCAIGAVVVFFQVKETTLPSPDARRFTVLDNAKLMLSDRRLRIVAMTLVAGQMSVLMIEPIFALFIEGFQESGEYVATLTGGIFSISGVFMVVSAPWWGRRNDRMGYRKNLTIGLTIAGVAYFGHILVANLIQLSLLRAVLGFVRGGVLPTLYSLASVFSPQERRGGMMAIASSLTITGNMIGPIVGGYVAGHFGITAVFVANGTLLLATGLLVWRFLLEPRSGFGGGGSECTAAGGNVPAAARGAVTGVAISGAGRTVAQGATPAGTVGGRTSAEAATPDGTGAGRTGTATPQGTLQEKTEPGRAKSARIQDDTA